MCDTDVETMPLALRMKPMTAVSVQLTWPPKTRSLSSLFAQWYAVLLLFDNPGPYIRERLVITRHYLSAEPSLRSSAEVHILG